METESIKSLEGVRNLMTELWTNHANGLGQSSCRLFMVDLPEPTEEEKRIMTANRENRKPFVIEEETLKIALENATVKLRGW